MDLKFGYDTHGFRKCLETGDWWDVFSGFYISDRKNADGTGPDVPEGFLKGTISGGVEVNVWIIWRPGSQAGVTLSLYADLNDPDGDGKVHFDEFLANLDLGLMSTFDVSGDITAYLDFYVTLLGQRVWEYPFAEWELADFTLTEPQIYHDRYTSNNGHVTSTYVGVGPGLHVDGLSLESSADEDWYRFDLIRPDSIDVDVRFSQSRGDVDITVYDSTGVAVLGQSNTRARSRGRLARGPARGHLLCQSDRQRTLEQLHVLRRARRDEHDAGDLRESVEQGRSQRQLLHDRAGQRRPRAACSTASPRPRSRACWPLTTSGRTISWCSIRASTPRGP